MSEKKLSLTNVKLHASQIPETFPKPLKEFLTKQPDFNEEVQGMLESFGKLPEALQQELTTIKKQRQEENRENQKTIRQLQSQLRRLEGK